MTFPLDINCTYYLDLSNPNTITLHYRAANDEMGLSFLPSYDQVITLGSPANPSIDKFLNVEDAFAYYIPTVSAWTLTEVNIGPNVYVYRSAYLFAPKSTYDLIDTKLAAAGVGPKSFTNPTRTLNTAYQISTTRDALVSYTVDVACTMSLTSGQSGTAVLEYADNSGFTTNVKTVAKPTASNSGTLTIGLALTQTSGVVLAGTIPAGKYTRIRTVNNTGTPTFTLQNAQEVLS